MPSKDIPSATTAADRWLNQDNIADIQASINEGEQNLAQLQSLMSFEPKQIGPILGRVKGRLGLLKSMEPIPWLAIGGGHLCVGHRPAKKKLSALKLQGATHLVTLLSESEGALAVKKAARAESIEWIWFPMDGGDPLAHKRDEEAKALFRNLSGLLEKGCRLYIHCSAGIHRTGMIANGLLRYMGYSQAQADEQLTALRQETSEGVGEHRKAWGERFA